MVSVSDLLDYAMRFLCVRGIENPKHEAELLLSHLLNCSRLALYLNRRIAISKSVAYQFFQWLRRRAMREPLQYILGEVEFFNVRLKVDSRVLIPRSETEMLVEWLVEKGVPTLVNRRRKNEMNLRILDLGTGSGAIAIALAKYFPLSSIVAVDRSFNALDVAQENATLNHVSHVRFLQSDWFISLHEYSCNRFDIIVANPPYLTRQEFEEAQDEIKNYEPELSLVSEDNGLRDIRYILNGAPLFLEEGGFVVLEVGMGHATVLQNEYGKVFRRVEIFQDLLKCDRFFIAYR
ncbi:MAG: peptide chain release factor N(5)-glutamine methyltransferase [Puniceicoccales bacterium]|jgi:release factor glutamine methyltransferase|nr:peptide chain release factor N(5)-glutamine methyltransferase [Puniceicoccales bacterium]